MDQEEWNRKHVDWIVEGFQQEEMEKRKMRRSKKITCTFSVVHWGIDFEGTAAGDFLPSTPDVPYLRNGDPGYPGDPAEFEPDEIIITDIAGVKLADPIILGVKEHWEFYDTFQEKIDQSAADVYADEYDGPEDEP